MASIGTMIEHLDGLRETPDLTPWENEFVTSIVTRYQAANKDSRVLSGKQIEVIARIWGKHFAG